jgi:hypothetical protein
MNKVHDFTERLAWSENELNESFWLAAYSQFFPSMIASVPIRGNNQVQKDGVDRIIILNNNRKIHIDEKIRAKDYPDIALEFIHTNGKSHASSKRADGWIEKPLFADYIAYAFAPSRRVYFLDWLILRRAWVGQKQAWKSKYTIATAYNSQGRYYSHSLCVPIEVLIASMSESSCVTVIVEAKEKLA